jgi:hypothetical protein
MQLGSSCERERLRESYDRRGVPGTCQGMLREQKEQQHSDFIAALENVNGASGLSSQFGCVMKLLA